jgi:preprotein translocase subunit SecB
MAKKKPSIPPDAAPSIAEVQRALDATAKLLQLQMMRLMFIESHQHLSRTTAPDALANNVSTMVMIDANNHEQVLAGFDCVLQASYADTPDLPPKEEIPLYIRAIFQAIYRRRTMDPLTEENLKTFGDTVGLLVVWPYWRELVQSTTSRMNYPIITLPMIQARINGPPALIFGSSDPAIPASTPDMNRSLVGTQSREITARGGAVQRTSKRKSKR